MKRRKHEITDNVRRRTTRATRWRRFGVLWLLVALAALIGLPFAPRPRMQAKQTLLPTAPGVGQLGGPLAGLTASQTSLFDSGYADFNIFFHVDQGLGPVFTGAGCFNCHGGGDQAITQCKFNPVPSKYSTSLKTEWLTCVARRLISRGSLQRLPGAMMAQCDWHLIPFGSC